MQYTRRYRKGDVEALAGRLLLDSSPELIAARERFRRSGASLKAMAIAIVSTYIVREEEYRGFLMNDTDKENLTGWVTALLQ